MRIKHSLATMSLAAVTFFAGSAPAAPLLDRPVTLNPDSSFILIHGHGGGGGGGGFGGGFGGGHGGFGGGFGGFGGGHMMGGFGGFGPRVATVHGFGGHRFAARPFATRTFAGRRAFLGSRFHHHHHPAVFRHGHHRHRIFVTGVGWVYPDYCVWPYNWGPWCYY